MMSLEIFLLLFCLAGTAFFAGVETDVISINRLRLQHLVRRQIPGAKTIRYFLTHADVLLAFELAEGARMIPKLAPKAKAVINTDEIIPTNVALKQGKYLADQYLEVLKKALPKGIFISAAPLALKAGDARTLNVVMLGAATGAKVLPFTDEEMRAALKACIKPKLLKMNEKAFDLGIKEAERWCGKKK